MPETNHKVSELSTRNLITSAEVDFRGEITLSSLTNLFIQSAWKHAENLGWGVDTLHEKGLVWVLWGLKIKIIKYPKWRKEVEVKTWPKGIHRVFYLRDFLVYDEAGEEIACACSNWLLIDANTRRPKMSIADDPAMFENKDRHALDKFAPSLNPVEYCDTESIYQVKYSDIDINQHLTTTKYIDIISDTFSTDFFKVSPPKEITLNFLKEIKSGQKIKVCRDNKIENEFNFQFLTEEESKPNFLAKITF